MSDASNARTGRSIGIGLLWLGLAIGALTILGATGPLSAGAWAQAETMGVALFAAIALCAAGLCVLTLLGDDASRAIGHPVVLVFAGLGLWSLVAGAFAEFPFLSLFGAPENSEGALWFFGFAVFTASGLVLRASWHATASLLAVAAAGAVIAALGDLPNIPELARPRLYTLLMGFNEYQAHFALGVVTLGAVLLAAKRPRFGTALMAAGALALLTSRNRVAMIAIGLAVVLVLLLRLWPPPGLGSTADGKARLRADIVACLAILAVEIVPYATMLALPLQHVALSLYSRQILFNILEPSMFDSLRSVFVGHGWGHFAQYLDRNVTTTGISLIQSEWPDLARDEFHSHNALVEAYFAAGLPGLLFVAAAPMAIVLTAQRRYRSIAIGFALAWAAVDSFWFMMPATMVVLALAMAMLAESSIRVRQRPIVQMLSISLLALLAVGAGWAAYAQREESLALSKLTSCLPPHAFHEDCASIFIPNDPRGADLGLAKIVGTGAEFAIDWNAKGQLPAPQAQLTRQALRAARFDAAQGRSLRLSLALVTVYGSAAFSPDGNAIVGNNAALQAKWGEELLRAINQAPKRSDVAVTFMNWLVRQGQFRPLGGMVSYLSAIAPQHPVNLWFEARVDLHNGDTQSHARAVALMRQAFANGLERFMRVNPAFKKQITSAK
jgi:hypothetical protein